MDTIKKLCEGVNPVTRRLILAVYYRGCADGLKVRAEMPASDLIMLKNQAE